MKVQLLVSEWCPSCHQAERVWQDVAGERDIDFAVVDMAQPEGRELVSRLRLKSVPSIVIDGELKAVGAQTKSEALELVAEAPERESEGGAQHIGISMATQSRIAVLSGMAYLVISGAFLVIDQGLFASGYARVAPLHLFTLGFLTFMIYGVGEHMLPRFTEQPIRLGAWSWSQIALAHLGVLGMVAGLWAGVPALAVAGAGAAWVAMALFAARLWPVLWPRIVES